MRLFPHKIILELSDGRVVEANVYTVIVSVEYRTAATIAISFNSTKAVVVVRTLDDLRLRVGLVAGKLKPTRSRNIAYFYTISYSVPGSNKSFKI